MVLGLDPSSTQVGWARVDVETRCLRGAGLLKLRGDLTDRLARLRELLPRLMEGADVVGFERMFSKSNAGDRALHAAAATIKAAAKAVRVKCHEIPCMSARLLVLGKGTASKDEVEAYVLHHFALRPGALATQDVSDAACIALAVPAWPAHEARIKAERKAARERKATRKAARAGTRA